MEIQVQKVIAANMLRMDGANPGKFHGRFKFIHSGIIKEIFKVTWSLSSRHYSSEEWPT